MQIGYHASHEQFDPAQLSRWVVQAGHAGFDAAMCSDHFHPWTAAQGHSGHAWTWAGAALAGSSLSLGLVNCPSGRYHPAVIAQASATLAVMFPQRFWLAVGSGEALNEAITGERWPLKAERNARLLEAVQVMRALWAGEEVTHRGRVVVEGARLYTRPEVPPMLVAAALTAETARWAGGWADALITVSTERARMAAILQAFREGGGEGKPAFLQVKLSYDRTQAEAQDGAMQQWRSNALPPSATETLQQPRHYEALGELVTLETLAKAVRISADPGRHAAWLREDMDMGFDRLYLHNVNRQQDRFIEAFAAQVLPALR